MQALPHLPTDLPGVVRQTLPTSRYLNVLLTFLKAADGPLPAHYVPQILAHCEKWVFAEPFVSSKARQRP